MFNKIAMVYTFKLPWSKYQKMHTPKKMVSLSRGNFRKKNCTDHMAKSKNIYYVLQKEVTDKKVPWFTTEKRKCICDKFTQ